MFKLIIFFFLSIFFVNSALSQLNRVKPVVEVDLQLPKVDDIKKDILYTMVLKEYRDATALQSQLKTLNQNVDQRVPDLIINSKTKPRDLREAVKTYHDYAVRLYKQVLETKVANYDEITKSVHEMQNSLEDLRVNSLMQEIKLRTYTDSTKLAYLSKFKEMYVSNFKNSVPIASLSLVGNQFMWNHPALEKMPFIGGRLDINMFPFLTSTNIFSLWAEYSSPNFVTLNMSAPDRTTKTKWNTNMYSIGAGLNFPSRADWSDFSAGLNIGGGYYWGESKIYNNEVFKSDFKGGLVRFEGNLRKYSAFYPIEIFIAYSIYYPSTAFVLSPPGQRIQLSENSFTSLSLGLRLSFMWLPNNL